MSTRDTRTSLPLERGLLETYELAPDIARQFGGAYGLGVIYARAMVTEDTIDMANPKLEVLTPQNCQLIFIDHEPQMAFAVQSIDRQVLKNNTVALAKAAKLFKVPTAITTVETEAFSGYTYPELLDVFPDAILLDRSSMNSWDDKKVRDALKANARNKVVVSGMWTEVCNNTFALSAMLEGGYEIYMVADASGADLLASKIMADAHSYSFNEAASLIADRLRWVR
jgi:nicotinamidase-related amidase